MNSRQRSEAAMLSLEQARRFYDKFGAKQDNQGFYEDAALDALVQNADFQNARSVLEIGCGTGKFAQRLLEKHLPPACRYVGIDISATMVALAKQRTKPWAERAAIILTPGGFDFTQFGGPFDRMIATYVFDLLSEDDINKALAAARATAAKGALLCVAGLTFGIGPVSKATSSIWTLIHKSNPSLVGGCRPISFEDFLSKQDWRIVHQEVIVSATIPSQVLIARAL